MSKTPSQQKRNSYRLSANVRALFTPLRAESKRPVAKFLIREKWLHGFISDLSLGGMCLTSAMELADVNHIAILFTLPSGFLREFTTEKTVQETGPFGTRARKVRVDEPDFPEMEVYGKIVTRTFNETKKTYQHHISFIDLPSGTLAHIERFVLLSQRYNLKHRRHIRQL